MTRSGASRSRVYADNAATTRLSPLAYERMLPFLCEEYGNPSQPYSFSRSSRRALRQAREAIAACIGADPDEIAFTSGGTESDNWAIKGFALADASPKRLVTSVIEHHAVLESCAAMARLGHEVVHVPVDGAGRIGCDAVKSAARGSGNALVSCMFANNEIGTVQPIAELCAVAHDAGALFHTDAVQAVGHVPMDVHALGVDFLSASGHKFNGPRGIGFLYIRKGAALSPYVSGGAQESGRRAGTENVAGAVGMAAALEENCSRFQENARQLEGLERVLLEGLGRRGVAYQRNGTDWLPGLLSLSFPGASGEMLLHRLDLMGISISTGSACDGAKAQVSHVLRAIGLGEEWAGGTVRISLGRDNTVDDVRRIADGIANVLKA